MMLQPTQSVTNVAPSNTQSSSGASGTSGTGLADAKAKNSLDYDDFLNLLVTQLKYQDPLSPMENTEFLAQNAQFSTVEQLMAIRDTMEAQNVTAAATQESAAVNMIGKLVAADVSTYDDNGELIENYVTGVVEEVSFLRHEGKVVVRLDDGSSVYMDQIVSVRDVPPSE